MAVKHDRDDLLKNLKKKIRLLQKREEQSRVKLQAAIKTIHKLAHEYRIKLALKKRVMENKIADARKKSYTRIIEDIEDMIIKSIKSQGKVLTSAIEKIEKLSGKKRRKK